MMLLENQPRRGKPMSDDNVFTSPPERGDSQEDYEEAEREERKRSVADIILDGAIEDAIMRRKRGNH